MKFMLDVNIKEPSNKINYQDGILIVGSCFTEHIGGRLLDYKFRVLQNPSGILFDPLSVCSSLNAYLTNEPLDGSELYYLNELWHSWDHHSSFSGQNKEDVVACINETRAVAHKFITRASWIIITLGSSFHYRLKESGKRVANCHRAPAQLFTKEMIGISETTECLQTTIANLKKVNPAINILLTVSPVRHIRDGVVENNRSKARLIESVHDLVENNSNLHYFPAYEIMVDVLRDYRFYDIDLVHPNYAGTEYVFEQFRDHFIDPASVAVMEKIKQVTTGCKHRPFQPNTMAHRAFLSNTMSKLKEISATNPDIDFNDEDAYLKRALEDFS
ncbi:GSCFA domain-containing protein [Segetibacter sp. 3557_3]|uniref:GSCFA domain-containing protein n=1 Tax=Segetibacter sp. 3557_3 TaxID=2547429 RepID=UPI001058A7CE|nr:GSCFA domain-containing protein [Segetibacter sp. 3557_3]TDH28864.1 GSCFA domain-containing protein [Segetibacter sp. 3557_3]